MSEKCCENPRKAEDCNGPLCLFTAKDCHNCGNLLTHSQNELDWEKEFDEVWRTSMFSSNSAIALHGKKVKDFIRETLSHKEEEMIEIAKTKWYHAGCWHDAGCRFVMWDEGVCNCKSARFPKR